MPGDFSFKDYFKKGNDRCSLDTYYVPDTIPGVLPRVILLSVGWERRRKGIKKRRR